MDALMAHMRESCAHNRQYIYGELIRNAILPETRLTVGYLAERCGVARKFDVESRERTWRHY